MIQTGTLLYTTDNSGVFQAKCIKLIHTKRKRTQIGDILIVSIKKILEYSDIKEHTVFKSILVRNKEITNRKYGLSFFFKKNEIIILDNKYNLYGNKLLGCFTHELRKTKYAKILALASCVI